MRLFGFAAAAALHAAAGSYTPVMTAVALPCALAADCLAITGRKRWSRRKDASVASPGAGPALAVVLALLLALLLAPLLA